MNITIARLLIGCLAVVSLAAHADQQDPKPGGLPAPVEAASRTAERFTGQRPAPSCQASYNRQRNNCTILSGCGAPGVYPVAHPPGCACTCVPANRKEAKPAPVAREQGK